MIAEILTIGDEILNGSRLDTDAAFLARRLETVGIEVRHQSTTGDSMALLEEALTLALRRAEIVIATGGLGPTEDDITKKAICKVFKRNLVFHEDILEGIRQRFIARGVKMPAINQNQALLPQGARFLTNRIGSALGIVIEEQGRFFCALPGVPREMEVITDEELLPLLRERAGVQVIIRRQIRTTGIMESTLAELINPILKINEGVHLAYLPSPKGVDLVIRGVGTVRGEVEAAVSRLAGSIRSVAHEYVYAEDERELEEVVGDLLATQGKTLAVAESCTAGLLGGRITNVSGSSRYFLGGVTAYADVVKERQLSVPVETIEKFGAVSAETARAMARGIRSLFEADLGVAITGIAGPTGGTEAKPVGLVFVAVSSSDTETARQFHLGQDREMIRQRAVSAALEMVRQALLGKI